MGRTPHHRWKNRERKTGEEYRQEEGNERRKERDKKWRERNARYI